MAFALKSTIFFEIMWSIVCSPYFYQWILIVKLNDKRKILYDQFIFIVHLHEMNDRAEWNCVDKTIAYSHIHSQKKRLIELKFHQWLI